MWRAVKIGGLCLIVAALPAFGATDDDATGPMQKQFQSMQQTMNKMHTTNDPAERNTLMHQHMSEMMAGMQMMNGMMGGSMSGGMMGQGQSGGMMGKGQRAGPMEQRPNLQQQMSMMGMMMNQMMQHMQEQEQQRLNQQK